MDEIPNGPLGDKLLSATGLNGSIELYDTCVKIVRDGNSEEVEFAQIAAIQFSRGFLGGIGNGFIHITPIGEHHVDDYSDAERSPYGVVFGQRQNAAFGRLRRELQRRVDVLRWNLMNRRENFQLDERLALNGTSSRILDKGTLQDLIDTVNDTVSTSVSKWSENEAAKRELELKEQIVEDKQHRRAMLLLGTIVVGVFVMCTVSLYKEQYELVKWILGSSFAAGAGAGLKEALSRRSRKS